MMKQRVDSDKDDNKDPNGKNNDDLIFDTTTNLWLDAFLAERGGILTMMMTRNNNDKDNSV